MSETTIKREDEIAELYAQNSALIADGSPDYVNNLRAKALESFQQNGIPSSKNENYKYLSLANQFADELNFEFTPQGQDDDAFAEAFHCGVDSLGTHNVIFVNGWYYQRNKALENLPKGVLVGSLAKILHEKPELFATIYGKMAEQGKDAFTDLNTAIAQDGFLIYVPKNVALEMPIQIVNVMWADTDSAINQRNLIVLEENAQAKVLICDHTLSPNKFVINSVTEASIGKNANLELFNIQNQHNLTTQINSVFVKQYFQSVVKTNHITLHSGTIRNNLFVSMEEEYAECNLNGLYLTDKNQQVDNFSIIEHKAPNCTSNELFKGVMDDRSTANFCGKIIVAKGAQKTMAFQRNNNLLLTNDAKINTKPQLEIYADDVKCSHGATIGQLNQDALFYLRSRGLSFEEARLMLMYAFTYEVLEKISIDPLKENIRDLVEKRFRGELSKCHSCVNCGTLSTNMSCF